MRRRLVKTRRSAIQNHLSQFTLDSPRSIYLQDEGSADEESSSKSDESVPEAASRAAAPVVPYNRFSLNEKPPARPKGLVTAIGTAQTVGLTSIFMWMAPRTEKSNL